MSKKLEKSKENVTAGSNKSFLTRSSNKDLSKEKENINDFKLTAQKRKREDSKERITNSRITAAVKPFSVGRKIPRLAELSKPKSSLNSKKTTNVKIQEIDVVKEENENAAEEDDEYANIDRILKRQTKRPRWDYKGRLLFLYHLIFLCRVQDMEAMFTECRVVLLITKEKMKNLNKELMYLLYSVSFQRISFSVRTYEGDKSTEENKRNKSRFEWLESQNETVRSEINDKDKRLVEFGITLEDVRKRLDAVKEARDQLKVCKG
jgi:hypothetical protein